MSIAFVGGFFPKETYDEILSRSRKSVQNAANAFQWAFITGLEENLGVAITQITAPFIGHFPLYYSGLISKRRVLQRGGRGSLSVGFLNLPLLKNVSKYHGLKRAIRSWATESETDPTLFIYSMNLMYLKAAVDVKREIPKLRICLIVTDLPEYPADSHVLYKYYIQYFEKPRAYKLLSNVDSFVLLTDEMSDVLQVGTRKWIRVEGLYNEEKPQVKLPKKSGKKIIFYSGTLNLRYGVDRLLQAFSAIKSTNYELWICGGGYGRDLVLEMVQRDSRIKYLGLLPREEVLSLQTQATLLVNPRSASGEYNRYSFPSKTMEYLASGTPVLLYKLPGIPKEYFDHCYTVSDDQIETLSDRMFEICEGDEEILNAKGRTARNFILSEKTAKKQCREVLNMLEDSRLD